MEIILTKKEAEDVFFNAMCNGLGYVCQGYDLQLDYNQNDYKEAKSKLPSPCFEDVLMQILRDGNNLTVIDIGCDGEYTKSITLNDVHERVAKTPISHLMNMINEEDDAITADVVLQTVFFEDVIFG